jgi:hypothetical protein
MTHDNEVCATSTAISCHPLRCSQFPVAKVYLRDGRQDQRPKVSSVPLRLWLETWLSRFPKGFQETLIGTMRGKMVQGEIILSHY